MTESASHNQPDDSVLSKLLYLARSFKASKAFLLAGKLKLFTILHNHPQGMTATELAMALGLRQDPSFRGAQDFFDILVALQLLDREGDGPDAQYNTMQGAVPYLVEGQPNYIGGILALNNDRSYVLWEYLEEALKAGSAPEDAFTRVPNISAVFQEVPAAAEHFALGMLGASRGNFAALAQKFDFFKYHTFADFGGSTGCCCVCVVQQHPHMRATTYDTPALQPVAEQFVAAQGVADKVKVESFDFFSDMPFPKHDVIAMGMVMHDWGLPKKMQLLTKAYNALPPGGAFIAIENLIDDERWQSVIGLAMSLNMLVEFGAENSFDFSFKEFVTWCTEVGFTSFEKIHLAASTYAAVAYK